MRRLLFILFLSLTFGAAGVRADELDNENGDLRQAYSSLLNSPQGMTEVWDLKASEREFLFNFVKRHPVTGLTDQNIAKYDPSGEVGYCFGRAMAAHLTARRMGLRSESIRKLFVIGDLRSGADPEWRFHLATLVRGRDGGGAIEWYAIDPVFPHVLKATEWMHQVRSIWDKQSKAYFYLTGTDAILPDIRMFPGPAEETGAGIIELAFNPKGKSGISKGVGTFKDAWILTDRAVDRYFLAHEEMKPEDQFDFVQIDINEGMAVYGYHGYFRDLIQDLKDRPATDFVVTETAPAPAATAAEKNPAPSVGPNLDLRSMRLGQWL